MSIFHWSRGIGAVGSAGTGTTVWLIIVPGGSWLAADKRRKGTLFHSVPYFT